MFRAKLNGNKHLGQVIFIKDEDSFDFEPSRNADITLMLNNLYLGIDSETMLVQQVWGFCPKLSWIERKLKAPLAPAGQLICSGGVQPGISKRLDKSKEWKAIFDRKTGWVCIGEQSSSQNEVAVEFAVNTIAVLDEEKLKAIWLKPNFI